MAAWLADITDNARLRLERAESSTRRLADGVADEWKKASDSWRQRVERAVDALLEEPPAKNYSRETQAAAPVPRLPPRPAPTAETWRAEESARWVDEAKQQHWKFEDRPTPPVEVMPAIEAATSRLRRTLMLQAAKRREEAGEEEEDAEEAAETGGADRGEAASDLDASAPTPAPPPPAPAMRRALRADDLVYEDSFDEIETDRTAAAARQQAAAEARAAALERELEATRRRLDEAAEAAAAARRDAEAAAAASARAYTRPDPAAGSSSDANLCVVCLEDERTHILYPCGHRCLCGKCAARYEAHMRCDGTFDDGGEDADEDLKAGGKGKKSKRRTQASSSSRAPSISSHACPLCRKAVTGVIQVWE